MKDVVQLGVLGGLNKSRIPPKSLGKLPSKKARKPVKQASTRRIADEVVAPVLPALILKEEPIEHTPPFSEPAPAAEPAEVVVQTAPESFPDELLIVTPEPELTSPGLELPLEEVETPKKRKKKEEPSDQPIELDLKAENTPA